MSQVPDSLSGSLTPFAGTVVSKMYLPFSKRYSGLNPSPSKGPKCKTVAISSAAAVGGPSDSDVILIDRCSSGSSRFDMNAN